MKVGLRHSGFTLIELVVAVSIVGILSVIAIPSYQSYMLRTNRTAAKSALVDLASRQETFFFDRKRYATALSDLSLNAYLSRDGSTQASQSSNSIYQLSLAAATTATCPATGAPAANSFTLMAAPVGTQVKDTSCGTLCLTSTGIRLAAAGTAASCWSR